VPGKTTAEPTYRTWGGLWINTANGLEGAVTVFTDSVKAYDKEFQGRFWKSRRRVGTIKDNRVNDEWYVGKTVGFRWTIYNERRSVFVIVATARERDIITKTSGAVGGFMILV